METHELLQLLSPDIQKAQQRPMARLLSRQQQQKENTLRDYTRQNPQTAQRQTQYWAQRPQAATPTTCVDCQTQAPPGPRHIARCLHHTTAQQGRNDARTIRNGHTKTHNRHSVQLQHSRQGKNQAATVQAATNKNNRYTATATEMHIDTKLTADYHDDALATVTTQNGWEPVPADN
ncbi:hypothetical protein SARC_07152 [Sphaeroforma arctica JP610]|uniref:Uncharacterized protein n=1 Tax=Sphaeroforma arctica JP610 TaxID=667725 RepID=A0A0L0FVA5_9EUKA|nr:hypothetical protein SARC_07152 [Sphaeroforma arctica JP610]KNC80491.1 hypothetical protein SARC_07152 [Sphaeroforma arctica JP610]|eukprot:XP_014154393.1 hypothetical protein SARC_07152 [Sphaeroforma arctica JP610]